MLLNTSEKKLDLKSLRLYEEKEGHKKIEVPVLSDMLDSLPREEISHFCENFYDMTDLSQSFLALCTSRTGIELKEIGFKDLNTDLKKRYVLYKIFQLPSFERINFKVIKACIVCYPRCKADILHNLQNLQSSYKTEELKYHDLGYRDMSKIDCTLRLPFLRCYPFLIEEVCCFVDSFPVTHRKKKVLRKDFKNSEGEKDGPDLTSYLQSFSTCELREFYASFYDFNSLPHYLKSRWKDLCISPKQLDSHKRGEILFLALSEEEKKLFLAHKISMLIRESVERTKAELFCLSPTLLYYSMVQDIRKAISLLFEKVNVEEYRSLPYKKRSLLLELGLASREMGSRCDIEMYEKELFLPRTSQLSPEENIEYDSYIKTIESLNNNLFHLLLKPVIDVYMNDSNINETTALIWALKPYEY